MVKEELGAVLEEADHFRLRPLALGQEVHRPVDQGQNSAHLKAALDQLAKRELGAVVEQADHSGLQTLALGAEVYNPVVLLVLPEEKACFL